MYNNIIVLERRETERHRGAKSERQSEIREENSGRHTDR